MSEVLLAPVERKCRFEELFDASCIELIKLVPRNPYVRALILKLTGKMPETECSTFDQLKDWIEVHCEKRTRPLPQRSGSRDHDGGIAINVEFSDTEYGRADYSVARSGSAEFCIGAEAMLAIVQDVIDAAGGMDEVVDTIAGRIDADAWQQCEPDMDDTGDYNYNDHESSDTEDSETSYSRNDIRAAVRAFLEEQRPELLAEL